ncbi:MAG TPA: hypothetical protein VMS56_03340 [Thermoanaerobaculia bacterium]|nr:hypothetical protein [Thermoanaerobaculia bacterium]
MRVHRCLTVWAAGLLLWAAAGLAGATAPPEGELFRCELNEFVRELGVLPEFGATATMEAEEKVAALSMEEVAVLRAGFAQIPNWEQIPTVLASLRSSDLDYARAQLARSIGGRAPGMPMTGEQELEQFRDDFLFMLDQMAKFAPLMQPDYGERVAALRLRIEGMPFDALPILQKQYIERAPELRTAMVGDPFAEPVDAIGGHGLADDPSLVEAHACNCSCGLNIGCWGRCIDCIFKEIASLGEKIANLVSNILTMTKNFFEVTLPDLGGKILALPGQVLSFFTGLWDRIKTLLEAAWDGLLAIVPRDLDAVLRLLGFTGEIDFNWAAIASSVPTLAPPCEGDILDDVVAVAAEVCDRGGDALTELLFEIAPEDGLGLPLKIGVALLHFPLAYLCQCDETADAIEYADAQDAHREWTGERLDLALDTRATQSSVNALSLNLGDLDRDVEQVEAKLDIIEGTAGRIETNVDRANATSIRIEDNLVRIENTAGQSIMNLTTISETTRSIDSKVDLLIGGNLEQQEWLGDFNDLITRLRIEDNLLENRPDAISLFQLPQAFGGHLETVALIVADTINLMLAAGQPIFGAERELDRGDALRAAGDFVKAYQAYRSAYLDAVR